MVGTLADAAAALDALALVNMGVLLLIQINRVPGADRLTGVGHAALATVRHPNPLGGARVAGKRNHVYQRLFKKLVVRRRRLFNARAGGSPHVHRLKRQSAGQPDALLYNGPGQKDVAAILRIFSGDNFIGNQVNAGIVPALIGKLRHLCKHVSPDIIHGAVNATHCSFPPYVRRSFRSFLMCPRLYRSRQPTASEKSDNVAEIR
ncbi:hypothetical protein SDC9_122305 [bioreactor metagenome]|uniref:Uncharacterized protein n=1 Tax=bioreactor metagenome TaxID=1076179 RepID=A0A645CEI6_9ZZZZ